MCLQTDKEHPVLVTEAAKVFLLRKTWQPGNTNPVRRLQSYKGIMTLRRMTWTNETEIELTSDFLYPEVYNL